MTTIQIDAAVLEEIAKHLRFSQPAMIAADKINAILRDHAAREQTPHPFMQPLPERKWVFTCPKCAGHFWGTSSGHEKSVGNCHTVGCDFEWDRRNDADVLDESDDDTPTQSGECAGVCECGHDRDAHNGEFGCLETNGAVLICNCKYYRDRARGGR